ncbi:hypothetical protein AAE478_003607 [Parahypoxylon ruwenzoriense]
MSTNKSVRSRFSSPLHLSSSPSSHNRGLANEGQRSFMQRWLEPPVQNKPSFQEAGLVRAGVVENMAPLGTLPKAATHKRTLVINGENLSIPPPVKTRIVLKKPYTGAPAVEATPRAREQSQSQSHDEGGPEADAAPLSPLSQPLLPIQVPDDGEDDDYVPQKSKARPSSHVNITPGTGTRRHSARRRSARASPTPINSSPSHTAHTTLPHTTTHTTTNTTTTTTTTHTANTTHTIHATHTTPSPPRFRPPLSTLSRNPDKDLVDKVVESAVDEALGHYRYPTAWALRLLYDENSSDPHFVSMIEDIYYQRADADTLKEFNRLMCDKKKDGKRDNKGCYYFVPPSTAGRFTPHKPKPAPYGDLIKTDMDAGIREHFRDRYGYGDGDSDGDGDGDGDGVDGDDGVDGHVTKRVKLDAESSVNGSSPTKANGMGGHKSPAGKSSHKSPHKSPYKSPRGRKTRSGSLSSSSSLSSVPDDVPDDYEEYMDQVDDDLGVARPIAAEPNNAQIPASSTQPISAQQKKPAAKKKNAAPKHPPPPSHHATRHHPASRDSSMPAAVVANGAPHQPHQHHQPKHQPSTTLKFPSKFGDLDDSHLLSQQKLSKKLETSSATKGVIGDSFVREPLLSEDHDIDHDISSVLAVPPPAAAEQNRSSRTPVLSSRAARAAKRKHDDLDDSVSPTVLSFKADLEASSARNSRAATPSNPRSNKKPRAGLRVKTSPMKKKGTSAGIPRSSGDRPSPVGNGVPISQDDNDDSCYACGGNGDLVCCDGCTYSFHFLCIDPPMDEGHMPDEWYCNECKQRFSPPFSEHRGVFRSLLTAFERKNPRAFRLSEDVRDCFEGVRTGPEGEYEEIAPPKPKTTRKGLDEPFDFFKVRNADGPVLCHHCQKGTTDNRPIIPCSVCGLNWHLECLDPPLAVPPVPRTWRCPCHVEEMLSELPARLAPAHRYRKIKNAPIIEQSYSRGLANNGWIEIEDDDSDGGADAWRQHMGFGHVHRLSAKGIKLDFISRVHQNHQSGKANVPSPTPVGSSSSHAPPTLSRIPSLDEQQAALNLAQLARGDGDGVGQLIHAMMSQASPAVISMMAGADSQRLATGGLSSVDTSSLEAVLAHAESLTMGIRKILESRRGQPTPESTADNAAPEEAKRKASPSDDSPEDDNATMVEDDKSTGVGQDSARGSEVGNDKPCADSAMEID